MKKCKIILYKKQKINLGFNKLKIKFLAIKKKHINRKNITEKLNSEN